jgi:hypothetical protein
MPGHPAWNKGLKGIHLSPGSEFKRGQIGIHHVPVGTERTRLDKAGKSRVWVKVAEPNRWRLRAQLAWELANGRAVPRGFLVHHENRDSTDDSAENLKLLTRSQHINEHRDELETARQQERSVRDNAQRRSA